MIRRMLLIATIGSLIGCAQKKGYNFVNNTLTILANGGQYRVLALSPDIIKIDYTDSLNASNDVIAPLWSRPYDLLLQEDQNKLILSTESVAVHITIDPFEITYHDRMDGLKLKENPGQIRRGDSTFFRFALKDQERIYGTGGRALPLDRRGYRFLHYNRPQYGYGMGTEALNYSIPHILSSEKYMLLFDNPARSYFDIGASDPNELEFSTKEGNLTYYFINGDSYPELMDIYTDLTGKQDLPPIWAFGNLQSRFGYRSQKEAEEVLEKSLAAGYPTDAIILDIYWFGPELEDGKMGQLDWDYERWPDPKGMIQGWKDKGIKTVTVSEPFFTMKSKNFKELDSLKYMALDEEGNTATIPDFYFGEGGLLDIFKPEARAWMWDKYKELAADGVSGWWVDLGEPEKHPDAMNHFNGKAYQVHGAYGHEWAKMLTEGFEKDFPGQRLFHMGRSGFAGSQHYNLIPWSGDVGRNWSGFVSQPPILLSMALSGLGYMHSDAGGFSMAERDEELYIRWLQMAAFTPIFRPHADAMIAPEPVFWSEDVQKLVKPFVELRYKLLPYTYTTAWQNSQWGMPLMRPLFFEDENAPEPAVNQFFWGEDLLVVPVLEKGVNTVQGFLPEGDWYDYWTGSKTGSGLQDLPVNMAKIPVFVKAGSFVPSVELFRNTEEYTTDVLNITYYLDNKESTRTFYFDDGKTPHAYEREKFELLGVKAEPTAEGTKLSTAKSGYGYEGSPENRILNFSVIGLDREPSTVNGTEFSWSNGVLTFGIDQGQEVTIVY